MRSFSAALNGAFAALAFFMLLDSWGIWTFWDLWNLAGLGSAAGIGGIVGWVRMADSTRGREETREMEAVILIGYGLQEAPNVRSDYGCTPLHHAARRNNLAAVVALLNLGADPNARDGMEWTPLKHVIEPNRCEPNPWVFDRQMVAALLEGGADPIPDGGSLFSKTNLRLVPCLSAILRSRVYRQKGTPGNRMDLKQMERARKGTAEGVKLYNRLREQPEMSHEKAMKLVYRHLSNMGETTG